MVCIHEITHLVNALENGEEDDDITIVDNDLANLQRVKDSI